MDVRTVDSDQAIKAKIAALDLEPAIKRLVKIDGWALKQAQRATEQYRNFLYLKKKYGKHYSLPPSYDIDEVWHNHILHTKKYLQDCQSIFGEFLHHHPHHGKDGNITQQQLEEAFETETQMLHFKEFGSYLYQIKPENIKDKIIFSLKSTVIEKLKYFFHN